MTNEVVSEQELGGAITHTKKSGSQLISCVIKLYWYVGVAHNAFENDIDALMQSVKY